MKDQDGAGESRRRKGAIRCELMGFVPYWWLVGLRRGMKDVSAQGKDRSCWDESMDRTGSEKRRCGRKN